jgi:hypothetical protein
MGERQPVKVEGGDDRMENKKKLWKKIKSGSGKSWKYVAYERIAGSGGSNYKVEWTPTAACKKEWKKIGETPKKHTKYYKSRPL